MTEFTPAIFTHVDPDPVGRVIGTRMHRFDSIPGVNGLARVTGDKLELLAVEVPWRLRRQHRFANFIALCKANYESICVWHIENEFLHAALRRYGFTHDVTIDEFGERLEGLRWDRPEI